MRYSERLSVRQEYHKSFCCVSCKTKETLNSAAATTPANAVVVSQTSETSKEFLLNPAVAGLTSRKTNKAQDEHLQTNCSLCNFCRLPKTRQALSLPVPKTNEFYCQLK